DVSDSIGGWHNTRYKYYGAKGDRHGRGFLGFRQIQTYEDIHLDGSESVTTTIYSQSYPHTGSVLSSETRVDNTKVSESTNTYAMHSSNAGIEYPYLQSNTTHTWDIDASNSLVDSKTTTNVYDDYGNPTRIIISTTGDGKTHTVTTDNNYYPANISQWHLDRLQQTTVTSSDASSAIPTVVRVSDFQYNTNGLLSMERIEPNAGNALTLTTDYVYDSFGNITSQTVTGWNGSAPDALESRTTSTTYIDGTFPNTISNAIGQQETRVYDSALGVMLSQIGPNSLPTTWQYDSFGRRILETRPDNTSSHWQYGDCDNTAVQYCASTVTTTTSGAAPSTVYSDNLGRQLQSEGISFDGRKVIQHSVYNRLGQNDKATQPHFAGGTRYYTRFDYDNLGRIVHEIQPGFAGNGELKTQTIYQGRTQRIYTDINARNLKMKKVFDARGNVVEMRDYDGDIGFITQYRYDPIGNLLATVDAEGNTSSIRYDIRDRKVSMNDPDMGVWSYSYNAFGELIGQTDAQNNIVSMRYDKLGRLISRTEPEGSTTWSYDTAPGAGVGKLHSVSRTQDSYRQSFTYDSLGRSSASQTHILNQDYNVSTQYDRFSRIQSRVYPTGFSTRNHYTANGYLERVTEAASNKLYWQALAVDEFGNISQEKFGNGVESTMAYDAKTGYLQAISTGNGGIQNLSYTYDNLSNLMSRNDTLTGTNETFTYDSLNRLTQMNSSEYGVKTYDYTKLGNITQKSDFGADYVYGQNNAGPHAVTQVKRADGSTVARYNYDNNGRMTSGNGRTITWSSFNKPTKITRDTNGVAKEVNFIYGPDRARIAQQGTDSTTIYLQGTGAHFEKETQGSITRQRHFIYGGNGMAAIYTLRSNLTDDTRYIHKDHLGSIDTVTNDDSTNVQVIERRSFDPFGQSRTPSCITAVCQTVQSVASSSTTNRGFTGHEHLEEVGLIHMNGRVYDPELGRFLSADPNVQAPFNPQNLNRYSYVNNNPLSYTDPSGFFFKKLRNAFRSAFKSIARAIKPYIRTIVAIVIAVYAPYLLTTYASFSAGASTVAAGFLSGVVSSGGDLKQGIISGLTAGAFGGLHDLGMATTLAKVGKTVAHGVVGGLSAAASGGTFRSGFLSAAFTQGTTQAGGFKALGLSAEAATNTLARAKNAAVAAITGGVGSVVGGGKFQNGAVTGAFSRLFNDIKHGGFADFTTFESDGIPTGEFPDIKNKTFSRTVEIEVGLFSSLDDALPQPGIIDPPQGSSAGAIARAAVSTLKTNLATGAANFAVVRRYRVTVSTVETFEHRAFSVTTANVVGNNLRVIGVTPETGFKLKSRQAGVVTRREFIGFGFSTK
ncbi:MAG: hypothetical protein COB61_006155, partial [Thiotrichales bacterium]|nr:hypothetical protein [Thiotrichales bacterium]